MTKSPENADLEIGEIHRQLTNHPLFTALKSIDDLRIFMEWHVFAVWDFVSLLKRLQRDLTGSQLPWTPPARPIAARLINEIVLGEESDILPDGTPLSHFELYLRAMREIGADTAQIEGFVGSLRRGIALEAALARAGLPPAVASFVRATLNTALQGDTAQVLGSFFYGRENVIPAMFSRLLEDWHIDPEAAPLFIHYLRRHIDLDQQEHGPMAQLIIAELAVDDQSVTQSALAALRQRQSLWNALHQRLTADPMREVAE